MSEENWNNQLYSYFPFFLFQNKRFWWLQEKPQPASPQEGLELALREHVGLQFNPKYIDRL